MAFGFTFTLPTISGTHTDFPVLLREADFPSAATDGTGGAIANGGGDFVAYTDSDKGTQLPVEVVTFVSSGTPSVEVWIKIPTAATSSTIYIEADAVQVSQPAVTSTYGRNAVWSDYAAVLHLRESSGNGTAGEFLDSTGKGNDGALASGTSISGTTTNAPFGLSALNFEAAEVITLATSKSIVDGGDITMSIMMNMDTLSGSIGAFGSRNSRTDTHWYQLQADGKLFLKGASSEELTEPVSALVATTDYLMHCVFDASTDMTLLINGAVSSADTSINASNNGGIIGEDDYRVGTYFDNNQSRRVDGRISEVRLRASVLIDSWIATEYSNISSAGAWGTLSTWADATPAYTLALDNGALAFTGTAVALSVARTLALDNGAYTLSGTDLSLRYNRVFQLESGEYVLTGTDATLTHTLADFITGTGALIISYNGQYYSSKVG